MPENLVPDYGWHDAGEAHSHAYITPAILDNLNSLKAKRVLDLGCGNGALCAQLEAQGYSIVGVENDEKGCEIAASKHGSIAFYNLGVQDSAAEIIEKEGLFDVVVSTEVIEHLFAPHQLPQFSASVLREGGHLIITTPYHGYLKNLVLSLFNKWDSHLTPLWHGGHIKFWSKATLTQLLEENGFKVVGFSGVGRAPWLWKSMVLTAQKI